MRIGTKMQLSNSHITGCVGLLAVVLFLICAFTPIEAQATNTITISRGEEFQLSAMLLTNGTFGEPLSNQIVEFFDQTYNRYIGQAITDSQGIATISHQFSFNHPKGSTLLNATYRGNTTLALAPSCQYIPLVILSSTSMSLSSSSYQYTPNDIIEISIILRDDLNNPISNATLDLYYDEIYLTTTSTNSEGNSSISIDIFENSLSLGVHKIKAIYSGDLINYNRGVSDVLEIEIKQIPTSLNLQTPIPETPSLNHTVPIDLEVRSGEEMIPNASIAILIDDNLFDTILSNESGFVYFELRFDEFFYLGWHNLTLQYQGNLTYASSHVSYEFFLQSDLIVEVDYAIHAVLNESTTLSVSINDVFNRIVPNLSVNLSDSMTHYSESVFVLNSKDVLFEFPVTGSIGNRTVWITVYTTYSPAPVSIPLVLCVWVRSSIAIVSSNIDGFASPNQLVQFSLHLSNQLENLSSKKILYSILGVNETGIVITDKEGLAILSITAPFAEQAYEVIISFNGSKNLFELPVSCSIAFVVSSKIPVQVQEFSYTVDHLRKSISVDMIIKASNGTAVEGVGIELTWLENHFSVISSQAGRIHFDLVIPSSAGIFYLEYRIIETIGIESTSDIFNILISPFDSNASEGLGFLPLMFGMTISFFIPFLPILKKRAIFE